jgi:sugar-specific transcriptional regulator TrmB
MNVQNEKKIESYDISWRNFSKYAGLSEYEAKSYITLILEGPAEARRLSMVSGVPRSRVYGVLKKLVERGLVVELPMDPRKFYVTQPTDAFNAYLQGSKSDISEKVMSLLEFEEALSILKDKYEKTHSCTNVTPQRGDVWFIRGHLQVMHKIAEMLNSAKNSVDAVTTTNGLVLFYKSFSKLLDKKVESGVKVHIKMSIDSATQGLAKELNYTYEVEKIDIKASVFFLVIDERELLLVGLEPNGFDGDLGEGAALFSQNKDLCVMLSKLVDSEAASRLTMPLRKS